MSGKRWPPSWLRRSVGGVYLPNFQTKTLMVLPVHGGNDFVIIIPFNNFLYGWLGKHVLTKPDENTRLLTKPVEDSDRRVETWGVES